ncbi:MAG: helix-turn-helix transcriptional regulator [Theionarchaea archaeon]|nr:helix-turn-helix transcriptional regulator [Theionarchaea archaeon]MBU6999558.1 helix-turn-helix transcriptional regulator [Theionarchaea archaeon]MBU7020278.1 helix-turn-helix transcriptional regulator [Theionarchaea archaeon]MBU7035177.1 helix-turn-helix transcriptional regulator [Theionarchaea archaeon]MBU7041496.1 helix-turn-helix transcriptional regulator [Theionarchaea archaeon]
MTLLDRASVGKEHKFLEFFTLRVLSQTPSAGYDLIKKVEEKTDGRWVPSKGMVYPLLDRMEQKGLIKVQEIGERSKKLYTITEKGERELEHIEEHHKEINERFNIFRKLFLETLFPSEEAELAELFLALRKKVMEAPDKERAKESLQKFMEEFS